MPFYLNNHIVFNDRTDERLAWCLIPRRCNLSGRWMWMEKAFRIKMTMRGFTARKWPLYVWAHQKEFLWARLHGRI